MGGEIRVSLVGAFGVELPSGDLAKFRTSRAAEVLALLCLQRNRRIRRQDLAQEIWPDSEPSNQLKDLRPALSYARAAIGRRDAISQDGEFLALQSSVVSDWDDIVRREKALVVAIDADERLSRLLTLDRLLEGVLLVNWQLPWIDPYRARHETLRLRVLGSLCEQFSSRREWETGLRTAKRMLEVDSLSEDAMRYQLRFLAHLDRRSEAKRAFIAFSRNTDSTLAIPVSKPLQEFATSVIDGRRLPNVGPVAGGQGVLHQVLESLVEEEPDRVLSLLTSTKINWAVHKFGNELRPLLEKVLGGTSGWGADRRSAVKRLLQLNCQGYECQQLIYWATELNQHGDSLDRIAGCNYLATALQWQGEFGSALQAFDEGVHAAREAGDTYLEAVTRTNRALCLGEMGRYDDAASAMRDEFVELENRTEPNARYSAASAMQSLVAFQFLAGNGTAAAAQAEDWLRLCDRHQLLDDVPSGKATYGVIQVATSDGSHGIRRGLPWLIAGVDDCFASNDDREIVGALLWGFVGLGQLGKRDRAAAGLIHLFGWLAARGVATSPMHERVFEIGSGQLWAPERLVEKPDFKLEDLIADLESDFAMLRP